MEAAHLIPCPCCVGRLVITPRGGRGHGLRPRRVRRWLREARWLVKEKFCESWSDLAFVGTETTSFMGPVLAGEANFVSGSDLAFFWLRKTSQII
jgi:hypothetical protein